MGAVALLVLLLYIKLKYGSFLVVFTILFQYFQILYIFKSLILDWSDQVLQFFNVLSFFSFNLELAKPECINPKYNYFFKAEVFMLIPPIFFAVLMVLTLCLTPPVANIFLKIGSFVSQRFQPKKVSMSILKSNIQTSLAIYHLFIQVMYVALCTWILGYFSCKQFGSSRVVMVKEPAISCADDEYLRQMPYFVLGIIVYVLGIPLYFLALYTMRSQTKYLNLKKFATFLLYTKTSDYRENGQYVLAVHLGLKCLMVTCQAFLNNITILQAMIIILLVFTYLGFLLHAKPYLKPQHNVIDIMCQICSIITLTCGILFYVFQLTLTSPQILNILTIIVIATTCILTLVVLLQMGRDAKSTKVEYTAIKSSNKSKKYEEPIIMKTAQDELSEHTESPQNYPVFDAAESSTQGAARKLSDTHSSDNKAPRRQRSVAQNPSLLDAQ